MVLILSVVFDVSAWLASAETLGQKQTCLAPDPAEKQIGYELCCLIGGYCFIKNGPVQT
jgi:hypothetical protein